MLKIPGVVARLWGPVRPPRRPVCLGGGRKRKGGMQVTGLSCLRNSSVCACLTPHGPGTGSTASFPFRALAGEEHPCTLPLPLPSISHEEKTQGWLRSQRSCWLMGFYEPEPSRSLERQPRRGLFMASHELTISREGKRGCSGGSLISTAPVPRLPTRPSHSIYRTARRPGRAGLAAFAVAARAE